MTARPRPGGPGDAVPAGAEFAGWPPLGVLRTGVRLGPLQVALERADTRVVQSLERWAAGFLESARTDATPDLVLEIAGAERDAFLAVGGAAGPRARLETWREGSGLAMVTHHAALLTDPLAERGILLLARQDEAELDRSLQNALRVAAAWRLGGSGRGLLLHAAAVETGRGAVLLVGPSGAGKSTACRLSAPRRVLSDDVTLVVAPATAGGTWTVHASPLWAEVDFAARVREPAIVPLVAACALGRATAHAVRPLARSLAAALIAAHAPFPIGFDPASLAEEFVRAVPALDLAFAKDAGCWPVLESALATAPVPAQALTPGESGKDGTP